MVTRPGAPCRLATTNDSLASVDTIRTAEIVNDANGSITIGRGRERLSTSLTHVSVRFAVFDTPKLMTQKSKVSK